MTPRIKAVVDNTSMSLSHDGLFLVAKKLKIDMRSLENQELIVFLNRAKTRMKVVGQSGNLIGYIRMPDNRRIPLEAIQYLPQTFSAGGKIDIEAAIGKSVTDRLKARQSELREYPENERLA